MICWSYYTSTHKPLGRSTPLLRLSMPSGHSKFRRYYRRCLSHINAGDNSNSAYRASHFCLVLVECLQHQTDSSKKSHASIGHLLQEQKNGAEMTFHLSSCNLFLSPILKMDVINNSVPTIGTYFTDLNSFQIRSPM